MVFACDSVSNLPSVSERRKATPLPQATVAHRNGGVFNHPMKKYEWHGMTRTREYRTWAEIIQRCENQNNSHYHLYGGRGITICSQWRASFLAFFESVGKRPGPRYSIDRINNDGNYEPGNVCWATVIEQANNKRNNALITYAGDTLTVKEWSRKLGINATTIYFRLSHGWKPEEALSPPKSTPNFIGKSKLSESDVRVILGLLKTGLTATAVARRFGTTPTTICNIKCGRTWKTITALPSGV